MLSEVQLKYLKLVLNTVVIVDVAIQYKSMAKSYREIKASQFLVPQHKQIHQSVVLLKLNMVGST